MPRRRRRRSSTAKDGAPLAVHRAAVEHVTNTVKQRSTAVISEVWERYLTDLQAYCHTALKIQNKQDKVVPFFWNDVQVKLHQEIERMKEETGSAYFIIDKARQMGMTTYISARFFAAAHLPKDPMRVYILAQDDKTAKKLKQMYSTFYDNLPEGLRRRREKSNDHQEVYSNGSNIQVGTESAATGGRGGTISRYHASEYAFWTKAVEHTAGSFQQVSDLPGSEMFIESTANGATGSFYERFRSAELGQSRYRALFFPWTMLPEYSMPVPSGFSLSHEKPNDIVPSEYEYFQKHRPTMEQMAWRRQKIQDLSQDGIDGNLLFCQEYPITSEESFLSGSEGSFISPGTVEAARLRPTAIVGHAGRHPLIMGLDPAPAHGESASAVVWRRGRICYRIERFRGLNPQQLAEKVYQLFVECNAARLCVDESEGVGHHVVTHLSTISITSGKVVGVRFGTNASNTILYANRRAEIWSKMNAWLMDGGAIVDEIAIPGQATLASELLAPRPKRGNEKRIMLESKDQMRARGIRSPDGADALACTFVYPDPDVYGFHQQSSITVEQDPLGLRDGTFSGFRRDGPDTAITVPFEF